MILPQKMGGRDWCRGVIYTYGRRPYKAQDTATETIAAAGPAGTAMVFDGRTWHRTGANVKLCTDVPRPAGSKKLSSSLKLSLA